MSVVWLNSLCAVGGIVLLYAAFRVFGLLTPQIDLYAELKRGNVAVAIFIGALILGTAIIIAGAIT